MVDPDRSLLEDLIEIDEATFRTKAWFDGGLNRRAPSIVPPALVNRLSRTVL